MPLYFERQNTVNERNRQKKYVAPFTPDKIVPAAESNANINFESIISATEAANATNTLSCYKHQPAAYHQRSV